MFSARWAADGRLFWGRKVWGVGWADIGIGMGEEARGRRCAPWGETEAGDEEEGVSARDARSGSSRDFFFVRREGWTRWEEVDEGGRAGLPRRTGDWEWLCWDAGLEEEVVLPMLDGGLK